ncbi:unnamed protein product [Vitrella brassicaformis CCMP3155]|uniref:Cell division cycle 5-like protein n=1 Tax=Vitrella brassicaformis (strain CCMP3155) TaxID=1169540 RepID=A0A0G4EZG7_VITBC|nr:unnamed protein product [Vitrella brassicaformis CCMP3155]|eukprot:CEM04493.1 unnamed protein product [Vitrella brassicaformis CCMP3155]
MRIFIKGGVWKNSEDEILKAAVMKYGLNNWSRVASLLVRKSPKQCKARWYEWLDPSVKKTEWTRDEEEKLLHLAKLFPTQWRTIAPLVGRTAHQCLEHYEKLLDQAQGRDTDESNDPRRIRPGEIDPHPETKPSRADAVDMDEDEKEMLSEARARLANTRGKKAKRKAREKQLEEARRLASLQKRRELKAAGINVARWKGKRKRGIDYGAEIPFEQPAPAGFYEVGPEERPTGNLRLANISLQQIEGVRRDEEDSRHRKDDRRKLDRLKKENLPDFMDKVNALNDAQHFRKRTKLSLPAPQLTDTELADIVKLGAEGGALAEEAGGDASANLLANYAQTPQTLMTPMRTPRQENTVLLEAQNAIARREQQTPLLGGENPQLHATDLDKRAPAAGVETPRTPNPLASSLVPVGSGTPSVKGGSMTPGGASVGGVGVRGVGGGATPGTGSQAGGMTPFRDDLSLNEPGARDLEGLSKLRMRRLQSEIKDSLASLPAPVNEIEVAMPPDGQMDDGNDQGEAMEVDMEEVIKRQEAEMERIKEEERKKQTQVVNLGLPRPFLLNTVKLVPDDLPDGPGAEEMLNAEKMVHHEMEALLTHDALHHPLKGSNPPKKAEPIEDFSLGEIDSARETLEEAVSSEQDSQGHEVEDPHRQKAWDEAIAAYIYTPSSRKYSLLHTVGKAERISSHQKSIEQLKTYLARESKRAKKLEQRLETLTMGYQKKAKTLLKSIEDTYNDWVHRADEVDSYRMMGQQESAAIDKRTSELRTLLDREKSKHTSLQRRYASLKLMREELDKILFAADTAPSTQMVDGTHT